jgi:hypothetical protein
MSSWQYGTPSSSRINKAASGTKAWKTNLNGNHNDLEQSYLYSPCFDISGMSQPMISFSMAEDIENCGSILCDGAYLEYSFNGNEWTKLEANDYSINWYDTTHHLWNTAGFSRWHVATAPLPIPPTGKVLHLRFVLFSDPAVTYEGIGVDEIHIYDRDKEILSANGKTTIQNNTSANTWNTFTANNQIVAGIQPVQNSSNLSVSLFSLDTLHNLGQTQYIIPRSYVMQTEQTVTDSTLIRLYVSEQDIVKIAEDTTCLSCTRLEDAYTLGITQYFNSQNNKTENGTINDNLTGTTRYYNSKKVNWVPYMNGYRAEARIKNLGEIWFNNGGPTGTFAAGDDYLNFIAYKKGAFAAVYWHSLIDTAVDKYVVEMSTDNTVFSDVTTTIARNENPGEYQYTATQELTNTVYYRLRWTMKNSTTVHYSPVRKVEQNDEVEGLVKFEAAMASSKHVLTQWTSYIDGMTRNYLLESAINDGNYTEIAKVNALKNYGQQYYITDVPANVPAGSVISYRLTATLTDDTKISVPVQKVKWIDGAAVLNVYPNPSNDGKLSLQWNADPGTELKLAICDITGRIVEQYAIIATEWNNTNTITTIPKAKGLYLLKATAGKYTNTFKIVLQ